MAAVMPLLTQFLTYLGAALLVGGVFSRALLFPHLLNRRWLGLGFVLIWLGTIWGAWLTLADLGFTSLADVLEYLTGVQAGRATLTLLIGACVLLAAELGRLSWLASLGSASVLLWGLAGMGHGATHGDGVRALHALHAGAMSVWVAGVFTLMLMRGAAAGEARRFTPVALACVGVLALSGVLMTLSHAGNLLQLPQSAYGRTLLLKLALFVATLAIALFVRRAFTRARSVRIHLIAELVLLLTVLGVTGQLTQMEPPSHAHGEQHQGH